MRLTRVFLLVLSCITFSLIGCSGGEAPESVDNGSDSGSDNGSDDNNGGGSGGGDNSGGSTGGGNSGGGSSGGGNSGGGNTGGGGNSGGGGSTGGNSTLARIEIHPSTLSLSGGRQQAIAVGVEKDGDLIPLTHLVTWGSTNNSVASISTTGLVSINNTTGSATLHASYQGARAEFELENQGPVRPTEMTLFFNKPADYAKANVYIWTGTDPNVQQPVGGWPGATMTPATEYGSTWYKFVLNDNKYFNSDGTVKFIFNDGAGKQTSDLLRNRTDGSQWWTNATTPSNDPPGSTGGGSTAGQSLLIKVLGSNTLIAKSSAPDTSVADQNIPVGTALTVKTINSPLGAHFTGWAGNAAAYLVNPALEQTQLVVAGNSTLTLQAQFELDDTGGGTTDDPHVSARQQYASKCVVCHGENGQGSATHPAIRAENVSSKTLTELLEDINRMPLGTTSKCTGTTPGTCGYDIAQMLLDNGFKAPEGSNTTASCPSSNLTPQERSLRLLTRQEYLNTVKDLFGMAFSESDISSIPQEGKAENFDTSSSLTVSSEKSVGYQITAEKLATRIIVQKGFFGLASCGSNSRCIVEKVGLRVFRRPLSSAELDRYNALYNTTDKGLAVLKALLQSPYFLYRSELGTWDNAAKVYRLSNYEIASLLSYTFWATMPDETLMNAAAAGTLNVKQQTERLLNDPRAKDTFKRFASGWLIEDRYGFPTISSPALQQAMKDETVNFVINTVFDGHKYDELLLANYTYVNKDLAQYYGMQSVSSGWEKRYYTGNNMERSGVLGHASLLAARTDTIRTSPVKRGVFVRHALLCQEFPPPVAANIDSTQIPTSATAREATRQHTEDLACQHCHQYIDGVGFGLESFGPDGKYRTMEKLVNGQSKPVDSSGDINSLNTPPATLKSGPGVAYSTVPQLAQLIANSSNSAECYARQVFRYTAGRKEKAADECTISYFSAKFRNKQQNLRELMVEMAVTPTFVLRK